MTERKTKRKNISTVAFKKRLEALRDELKRLALTSEDERKPVELDQSTVGRLSRMDALQAQAMALEIGRRREIELGRIDAALRRIEKGDFGYCINCGEIIAAKRLKLDPTVPICIDCAE
ncbi:MAG: molecular chaperone DnaK [Rhodospirillales bacterium RIFCSPLOWO2_12_FULL_58_28]|nr:MAG: molecular chaperone DnaK [Rhodospirillales bacterium RIFCSPLOWO2_02_FULL_58_16]OHC79463.1 MAG: molecular chaperone DnaK [Rhodospirillales bacterium RIFCSPLOWO2_12_FULL_58_28]